MAGGIFQKLRTITLSNIHSVLNAVIDLNNIGAIEQYVRDLTEARNSLDDERARRRAQVRSLPAEIASLQAKHDEANESIDALLSDGDPNNDHHAASLEAKLMRLESDIKAKQERLTMAEAELAQFDKAVQALDTKIETMNARMGVLRDIDRDAKARDRASRMLKGVDLSETPNVDDVEQRLRERAAVSGNRLERELGRVTGNATDETLEAQVAARLAARRAKMTTA